MIEQQSKRVWNDVDTVEYYANNRHSYADLYDSEKYFLTNDFINNIDSVLDIGCAAGGMSKILHKINPTLAYTGLDIADNLVNYAQKNIRNELSEFYCYDGINMQFLAKSFDLIFCSGLLHLVDHYKDILSQMVKLSNKYILTDFRVTRGKTYQGKIRINFSKSDNDVNEITYHVLNFGELLNYFKFFPEIGLIEVFGYKGKASDMSHGINEVYMVFFKFHISKDNNEICKIKFLNDELKNTFGHL